MKLPPMFTSCRLCAPGVLAAAFALFVACADRDPDSLLRKACSHDSRISRAALRHITNQSVLVNVVTDAQRFDIKLAALQQLTDKHLLMRVATNTDFLSNTVYCHLCLDAVNRLADQNALSDITAITTWESLWESHREAALSRLTDQALLAQIATTTKKELLGIAAVAKLADSSLLSQVANAEGINRFVRRSAVEKLTDQVLLAKIATTSNYEELRIAAVRSLTNQVALAQCALADTNGTIRYHAIPRMSAIGLSSVLEEIDDSRLRASARVAVKILHAVERIPNQVRREQVLVNLMPLAVRYADPMWITRYGELETLVVEWRQTSAAYSYVGPVSVFGEVVTLSAKFSGRAEPLIAEWTSEFPEKLFYNENRVDARVRAVDAFIPWLIGDRKMLAVVASTDNDVSFRKAAVGAIDDKALLEQIAVSDRDSEVRDEAKKVLGSRYGL